MADLDDLDKALKLAKALIDLHAEVERLKLDAARYNRLRILGVAPWGSSHLEGSFVMCFTTLDAFVDKDIALHPSRGEATP